MACRFRLYTKDLDIYHLVDLSTKLTYDFSIPLICYLSIKKFYIYLELENSLLGKKAVLYKRKTPG